MIMKTRQFTLFSQRIVFANLVCLLLIFSDNCKAQKTNEVSILVYPGFTLVNFEKALDYPDDYMVDWNQFYLSVALRGFIHSANSIQFGAEIAWQRLYDAYYVIPYPPTTAERSFNVSTISLMALGRYSSGNFFLIGGGGIHSFESGLSPALCFETGYMLRAGENLEIPVSFRINPILGSGIPTPISIGTGISFSRK
jgi:hypothetical protein